jgi:hypothetical protein
MGHSEGEGWVIASICQEYLGHQYCNKGLLWPRYKECGIARDLVILLRSANAVKGL